MRGTGDDLMFSFRRSKVIQIGPDRMTPEVAAEVAARKPRKINSGSGDLLLVPSLWSAFEVIVGLESNLRCFPS